MHKPSERIDLNMEFNHIFNLIHEKWNTNNSLKPILHIFWNKGIEDSQNDTFICSNNDLLKFHIENLDFLSDHFSHSDSLVALNHHLPLLLQKRFINKNDECARNADKVVRINIENTIKNLYSYIKNNFPEYNKNRPVKWISVVRKYGNDISDFPEDYAEYVNNFKGHSLLNMGEFFPETAAISSLLYRRERETNFSPVLFLGRSIYQHAFFANRFNYALEIKNAFIDIHRYFNQPEQTGKIQGEFDFSKIIEHPFILEIAKDLPQTSVSEIDKLKENFSKSKLESQHISPEEVKLNQNNNIDAILSIIKKHRF